MTEETFSPKPTKYLVCVDGSEESRVALKLACLRVRHRRGTVDLLHVIAPPEFHTLQGVEAKMREEKRKEAEAIMQRMAAEAKAVSGLMPSLVLREGQPGEEILAAAADDPDIDILVLGVSAKSGSRGSTITLLTSQLGSKLCVPLLMVPGNLTDQQLDVLS